MQQPDLAELSSEVFDADLTVVTSENLAQLAKFVDMLQHACFGHLDPEPAGGLAMPGQQGSELVLEANRGQ